MQGSATQRRTAALFGAQYSGAFQQQPEHELERIRAQLYFERGARLATTSSSPATATTDTRQETAMNESETGEHGNDDDDDDDDDDEVRMNDNPMQLAVYNRDHSHERDDEPELHSERQHKPWRLMRVIGGHEGWIRSIAVEPGNQWFATGSVDSTVKVWDVASGALKLTLTGHISAVRGIAISPRQPYMFTVGEDKTVKCWDLEQNKVVRQYHGHLGGVYSVALHPRLDVLVTGGRDQVARVWDMRTRGEIMALEGHSGTISAIQCQAADPQVITGSHDQTVRLWDLAAGRTTAVLTHHSTSVRALVQHPTEFAFASASADSVRKWRCPEGTLIDVFGTERATATTTTAAAAGSIANGLALNDDGLLVAGCDDGALTMWDWTSAAHVQTLVTPPHPGSLSSENGVLCCTFDRTGLRLITGGADKMVKVYCEAS